MSQQINKVFIEAESSQKFGCFKNVETANSTLLKNIDQDFDQTC